MRQQRGEKDAAESSPCGAHSSYIQARRWAKIDDRPSPIGHSLAIPILTIHTLWTPCLPMRPYTLQVGLHYIDSRAPSEHHIAGSSHQAQRAFA